jgi:hypothetical protein
MMTALSPPWQSEWDRCRPWIEAALEYTYGTHTIEDIYEGVVAGRFHFWPGKNAAIITEFNFYPRFKSINFFLVGGDKDELFEMEPLICEWAKAQGCTRVGPQFGRRGWAPDLKAHSYTVATLTVSMKDL